LPAKYVDPITRLPFRNSKAFKVLREAYYQQLEVLAPEKKNPEIAAFLDWRRKMKLKKNNAVS
jgi:vacuolar protein sorting-associated protein 72